MVGMRVLSLICRWYVRLIEFHLTFVLTMFSADDWLVSLCNCAMHTLHATYSNLLSFWTYAKSRFNRYIVFQIDNKNLFLKKIAASVYLARWPLCCANCCPNGYHVLFICLFGFKIPQLRLIARLQHINYYNIDKFVK